MSEENIYGKMHSVLKDMSNFNKELPFYVPDFFTDDELFRLKSIIYKNRDELPPIILGPNEQADEINWSRYRPKHIKPMSRVLVEFDLPKDLEEKMDAVCLPLYPEPLKLCSYNYIKYDKIYSNGKISPILPPHIDADENIITFNIQLGTNIPEGWDVVVSGKSYPMKDNQALIFSAVNQVHWRPKRKFEDGEYLEILSLDYSPLDNYKFTGLKNPLDPETRAEMRDAYTKNLNNHPEFQKAWEQYNKDGINVGIEPGQDY